jgi:glycosyltransferase involved in cell wall biosynthesis
MAATDVSLVHLRGTGLFETVVPSKIFEAMAMGCPIIMGVKGPAREIVMQAQAGLPMEPDSESELVEILVMLADQPAERNSLSQHARAYVKRHYNRDDLAEEYLDLLASVTGSAKEPATRRSQLPVESGS